MGGVSNPQSNVVISGLMGVTVSRYVDFIKPVPSFNALPNNSSLRPFHKQKQYLQKLIPFFNA